jgi:SAM-dependent methyltransferase
MRARLKTLGMIARLINWRELSVQIAFCPLCDGPKVMVKLDAWEMAVRCISCRASAATMSMVSVLRSVAPELRLKEVYEMSSRGPLYRYLARNAKQLVSSEYFPDLAPGEYRNGVQCQDVQQLTYRDGAFDICTSTEVFEHVPDDLKGFSEIFRVLRSHGIFVFTVPLRHEYNTIERASITPNGGLQHLLAPEYHEDPFHASKILAFRDYGLDITDRLRSAGFPTVKILTPVDIPWGYSRPVVVAFRGSSR